MIFTPCADLRNKKSSVDKIEIAYFFKYILTFITSKANHSIQNESYIHNTIKVNYKEVPLIKSPLGLTQTGLNSEPVVIVRLKNTLKLAVFDFFQQVQ